MGALWVQASDSLLSNAYTRHGGVMQVHLRSHLGPTKRRYALRTHTGSNTYSMLIGTEVECEKTLMLLLAKGGE